MQTKREGKDYAVNWDEGIVYALDPVTSQVIRAAWHLWLELLRKQISPGYKMTYMMRQNVVCKTSCLSSYKFMFGLTGSLGTDAEKKYTTETFGASHFFVPSFLDTCVGKRSLAPKCVAMRSENNPEEQLQWTVSIV